MLDLRVKDEAFFYGNGMGIYVNVSINDHEGWMLCVVGFSGEV